MFKKILFMLITMLRLRCQLQCLETQMLVAFSQLRLQESVLLSLHMTDLNQNCQNRRVPSHLNAQQGSANQQISFSEWGNAWKKLLFSGHIANNFQRPLILQLNFFAV